MRRFSAVALHAGPSIVTVVGEIAGLKNGELVMAGRRLLR